MESVIPHKYLSTNLNRLAEGPSGLLVANNVRIEGGVIRRRKGQQLIIPEDWVGQGHIINYEVYQPIKVLFYNGRLWSYFVDPDETEPDMIGYYDPTLNQWIVSQLDCGPFGYYRGDSPALYALSFRRPVIAESSNKLLLVLKNGVYCSPKMEEDELVGINLESIQTKMKLAGCPCALPFASGTVTDTTSTYASNWLLAGESVAYRHFWKYTDENGRESYGEVSDRMVVENGSNNRAVSLSIRLPQELYQSTEYTARFTCMVFRTVSVEQNGAGFTPDPGDEMYLVAELKPTYSDVAARSMTFVDIVPNDVLQEPLYTNQTQEGIGATRSRPPLASSIETFAKSTFYGNIKDRQQLQIEILGVNDESATTDSGLRAGDILAFGEYAIEFLSSSPTAQIAKNQIALSAAADLFDRIEAATVGFQKLYNEIDDRLCDMHTITDPNSASGILVAKEAFDGNLDGSPATKKIYAGLYRSSGWPTTSGSDPCPISPTPVIGYESASNEIVGKGFKITRFRSTGSGLSEITLSAAPDFVTGDTVYIARPPVWEDTSQPVGSKGSASMTFTPGAYVVASIAGSVITLTGVSTPAVFDFQIGVSPYASIWTNLGIAFCVKSATLKMQTQACSTDTTEVSRVRFSPVREPESAPPLNYFDIGAPDRGIIAMKRLNESLFVFKHDGLYRIAGEYPQFFVEQFDPDIILVGPGLVDTMGGHLYCLAKSGVYQISETGAERISGDIQNSLDIITNRNYDNASNVGFAVGHREDHSVTFWLPNYVISKSGVTQTSFSCNVGFVFDGVGWTTRAGDFVSGACGFDPRIYGDKYSLYLMRYTTGAWLTKERHQFDGTDYCDESIRKTVASMTISTATRVVLDLTNDAGGASPTSIFRPGSVIVVNDDYAKRAVVTACSGTIFAFTVDLEFIGNYTTANWTVSPSTTPMEIFAQFTSEWQYGINASSDPTIRKHFSEVGLIYQQPYFSKADIGFSTDISPQTQWLTSNLEGFIALGSNPTLWPLMTEDNLDSKVIRAIVATSAQRCSQIKVSVRHTRAMEFVSVYGYFIRSNDGGKNIERNNG